jgi:hypothetical protein
MGRKLDCPAAPPTEHEHLDLRSWSSLGDNLLKLVIAFESVVASPHRR